MNICLFLLLWSRSYKFRFEDKIWKEPLGGGEPITALPFARPVCLSGEKGWGRAMHYSFHGRIFLHHILTECFLCAQNKAPEDIFLQLSHSDVLI